MSSYICACEKAETGLDNSCEDYSYGIIIGYLKWGDCCELLNCQDGAVLG